MNSQRLAIFPVNPVTLQSTMCEYFDQLRATHVINQARYRALADLTHDFMPRWIELPNWDERATYLRELSHYFADGVLYYLLHPQMLVDYCIYMRDYTRINALGRLKPEKAIENLPFVRYNFVTMLSMNNEFEEHWEAIVGRVQPLSKWSPAAITARKNDIIQLIHYVKNFCAMDTTYTAEDAEEYEKRKPHMLDFWKSLGESVPELLSASWRTEFPH